MSGSAAIFAQPIPSIFFDSRQLVFLKDVLAGNNPDEFVQVRAVYDWNEQEMGDISQSGVQRHVRMQMGEMADGKSGEQSHLSFTFTHEFFYRIASDEVPTTRRDLHNKRVFGRILNSQGCLLYGV